jgi:hypothetical protein
MGLLVDLIFVVKPGMAFARIQASGERKRQLADEPVV